MEIGIVKGEARQPGGRSVNRRLRRRGFIPSVVYGHGEKPETLAVSLHDLELCLGHKAHVIKVQAADSEQQYLIKDVQYDHLQKTPIHVDLMRVDPDERVRVKLPIELRGEPKGAHEGGTLVQIITDLEVECLLLKIPDAIRPHVGHLEVGGHLCVKDLELPEGVKVLHEPNDLVAVVRARAGVSEAETEEPTDEEAKAAEPKVFGRVAKEAEGEAKDGA